MVDCSIDGTVNGVDGGFAFTRDDWAADVIGESSQRIDREQLDREFRVRLDERRRIALELHDSLLQGFLGVGLQLQAAMGQVPENAPARAPLDRAMVRVQQVIEEARHTLLGLRSVVGKSVSLEQALSCLMGEFATGSALRCRVFVTGQPRPLTPAIQEQVYLIGREALINALRHSEATSIEAEVEYSPQWLRILVRDNGRGMDPKTVRSGRHAHWGLLGMRERAAGIGAELRIWSRPGAGTEVEVLVACRTSAEACISRIARDGKQKLFEPIQTP